MFHFRNTSLQQLPDIARCHLASFPKSFGTKLGYAFAIRSMEWFLAGENRFLFHITDDDDKVIGYCGGFQSKGIGDGSTSGMMQYAMKEAAIGMLKKPWLFFHKDILRFYPLIFKNIFRKITGTKKNPVNQSDGNNIPEHIGLVVIGVHPDYRGKGCFELLMQHFEKECMERKTSKMTLSVRSSNARAIAAYKKVGWQTGLQTEVAAEMYKILPR